MSEKKDSIRHLHNHVNVVLIIHGVKKVFERIDFLYMQQWHATENQVYGVADICIVFFWWT